MSRSVTTDYETLRELQARAQEPAATTCEAERRNKQASHYARNAWAAGRFDVGELQRILSGDGEPDACEETPNV